MTAMAGDTILILTTGGTIDKVYFDALSAYQIGEAMVTRILETGRVTRPFVVQEVMRKDSLEVTEEDRAGIVEHVARSPATRVVVTHGTDTMEETAYFLDLTLPADRPVIVTGAMRPSDMAGADGPANLTSSVRVATDPRARGRGAMVVMDDRVFAARDVTKMNSTRVETFQAPERGPIAIVEPEGVLYHQPSPDRAAPVFGLAGIRELPRVDVVYSYAGADSVEIDAALAAGAKGIVIAGVGRGNIAPGQGAALRRARAKGVVVVVTTRTGSGGVPVRRSDGMIGSGDLNAQKARVLLTLALSRTSDPAEVARIFERQQ